MKFMRGWNPHVQAAFWLVVGVSLLALFILLCIITKGAAFIVLVVGLVLFAFYCLIYAGITGQL